MLLLLPAGLFAKTPKNVVVVDTGNYYPRQRDGRIKEIEDGLTESQWVEKAVRSAVVKAFNNIYAEHLYELGRPARQPRTNCLTSRGLANPQRRRCAEASRRARI